jgi:nitroreductase
MRRIFFLVFVACFAVFGTTTVSANEAAMNDTLKTIFSRKSVREYQEKPVSEEKLMMLVRAGMAAPTAVDRRPWDFILITDKTVLGKLADALPYAKMARHAAAAIVVTGDLKRQFGGEGASYWMLDCSAATENILLAAESLGLGAVWTSVFPEKDRMAAVRKILGIPVHVVPLNLIPIGIPAGAGQARDKFNAGQIHRDRW